MYSPPTGQQETYIYKWPLLMKSRTVLMSLKAQRLRSKASKPHPRLQGGIGRGPRFHIDVKYWRICMVVAQWLMKDPWDSYTTVYMLIVDVYLCLLIFNNTCTNIFQFQSPENPNVHMSPIVIYAPGLEAYNAMKIIRFWVIIRV